MALTREQCETCGAPPAHVEYWYDRIRAWCEQHTPWSGHFEFCGARCKLLVARALAFNVVRIDKVLRWTNWPEGSDLPAVDNEGPPIGFISIPRVAFDPLAKSGLAGIDEDTGLSWMYIRDVP